MNERFNEILARAPEGQQLIIANYRKVTGAFNAMFEVLTPRQVGLIWRIDGVGSCAIGKGTADLMIEGPATELMLELREIVGKEDSSERTAAACPYHAIGKGCVLGDLKGPICLAHIEHPDEFLEKFAVHGTDLSNRISETLCVVLGALPLPEGYSMEEFVNRTVDGIASLSRYFERFPIVGVEEIDEFQSFYIADRIAKGLPLPRRLAGIAEPLIREDWNPF